MAETTPFDINQRTALLAIDYADRKTEVAATLGALGYRVTVAETADDAHERLRKAVYQIIVVDEAFQGGSLLDNPLLRELQTMPMATRRGTFVMLLAPGVTTLDTMAAFAHSVNAVVNYDDLAHLRVILERALADDEQFFRVLRSVLEETGRR